MADPTARDLIKRLADALDNVSLLLTGAPARPGTVVAEARAYLAAHPEPEPMFTAEEFQMIAAPWSYLQPSVPTPIPLSERLPTEADCDAEGRVWAWYSDDHEDEYQGDLWSPLHLRLVTASQNVTHWLPAHALPLPSTPDA